MDSAYAAIKERATQLAGQPGDIPRRVALHHGIYLDSGGNHAFPQIALHGALWACRFFETTGSLGKIIQHRYFYDREEREYRMGLLSQFSEGFKAVNRAVFIDTYTNYYFTREHGREPGAERVIHPDLLSALNTMHRARAEGRQLAPGERRSLYQQALLWEQEVTVAPGVKSEVEKFDCPILRSLCLKPLVRFAYFPRTRYFPFRNFSDKDERIRNAMRSYDIAERCGWARVVETMRSYGVLPEEFFRDPRGEERALDTPVPARLDSTLWSSCCPTLPHVRSYPSVREP
jgi:hypothetical protein